MLIFVAGNTQHRYRIEAGQNILYKHFVVALAIPVVEQNIDLNRLPGEEEHECPETLLTPLAKVSVSVYNTWKPGSEDVANFIALSVNNMPVDLGGTFPQGTTAYIVPIGSHETAKEHLIAWTCRAGLAPADPFVAISYFKGNDLTTRKILRVKTIDHFEEGSDAAVIKL